MSELRCAIAGDVAAFVPGELEKAWETCADLFMGAVAPATQPTEVSLYRELLFCLLGGFGVTFELAVSASGVVQLLDPFGDHWSPNELALRVEHELRIAQFEPRTASGMLRRYRYPTRKAGLVARASSWVRSTAPVLERLEDIEDERGRRAFLEDCPGVGPKTGSWILRNVGLASTLAILDVHVVRALEASGRVTSPSLPRDYTIVEEAFQAWCKDLGASPAAFDLFLWEWQRGSLHAAAV